MTNRRQGGAYGVSLQGIFRVEKWEENNAVNASFRQRSTAEEEQGFFRRCADFWQACLLPLENMHPNNSMASAAAK